MNVPHHGRPSVHLTGGSLLSRFPRLRAAFLYGVFMCVVLVVLGITAPVWNAVTSSPVLTVLCGVVGLVAMGAYSSWKGDRANERKYIARLERECAEYAETEARQEDAHRTQRALELARKNYVAGQAQHPTR
jgi:hypothetical protein